VCRIEAALKSGAFEDEHLGNTMGRNPDPFKRAKKGIRHALEEAGAFSFGRLGAVHRDAQLAFDVTEAVEVVLELAGAVAGRQLGP
jgi:hypothetical protein